MLDRKENGATPQAPQPAEESHPIQEGLGPIGWISVAFVGLLIVLMSWAMSATGCTPPEISSNGAPDQAAVDSAAAVSKQSALASSSTKTVAATDVANPADWQAANGGQLIEPPVTDGSTPVSALFPCALDKLKNSIPSLLNMVGGCITDKGLGKVYSPICYVQVWANGSSLKETEQMMRQAEVAFATFEPALQVDNAYQAPLPKGWTAQVRWKVGTTQLH